MTHSFITETKPPISPEELRYRETPDPATLKLLDVATIVFAILYTVPCSFMGPMMFVDLLINGPLLVEPLPGPYFLAYLVIMYSFSFSLNCSRYLYLGRLESKEEQRLLNLESGEFDKSVESKEISAVNQHNKSEDEVKTALGPRDRNGNETARKIYRWHIYLNLVYLVLWPILFHVRSWWGDERLTFAF
ncbi:hypothetical protein HYFRA_00011024 [Hymenoscyphus fraxineus]|uniref:Uncharacterized protein n=1 Tax=Hymenoscyphus fraxineus TaxID=746836 RepID=A0A9N9L7D5_9HELO|nr:hypothetical protein HYFRA_00011024 [Hymenoscyphus fraxineus]